MLLAVFLVTVGFQHEPEPKISLNLASTTIENVLKEIKNQTNYEFFYAHEAIQSDRTINVQLDHATIHEALERVFADAELNYSNVDNVFVIQPLKQEVPAEPMVSNQRIEISGTVTNYSDGSTLPGVTIMVRGTTTGTATDHHGRFNINVSSADDILVFSYIGYEMQEVRVGSNTVINVIMRERVTELSEVVVSAIGTTYLLDQSGSTSSAVRSEEIVRSGEAGLINALAGKASGVRIGRSSGDPGAGSAIQIRGTNTIEGASQPLIILDGIPISNDNIGPITASQQSRLDDLNMSDVESIQILKGASAASLWGSRAANGVIVITTKRGRLDQRPTVQYSFNQSFDDVNILTPMQDTYGQGRNGVWNPAFMESWGDRIADRSGGPDLVDESGAYFISTNGTEYRRVLEKNSQETFVDSNFDQLFQTGNYTQQNISIDGGGTNTAYYFSYENLQQKGIIKNFDYGRNNLRLNTTTQVAEWLEWTNNVSYSHVRSNRIHQAGNTTNGIMLGLLRTSPDFDITNYFGTHVAANGDVFPNRQRSYRRHLGQTQNPIYNNPNWAIYEQQMPNEVNRFIINPALQMNPLNWLQVIVRGGMDYYTDSRGEFYPINSASGPRNAGRWSQTDIVSQELNFDGIAIADYVVNQNFSLTATLGVNYNDRQRVMSVSQVAPFAVDSRVPTPDLNPDQAATSWGRSIMQIRSNRGYGILDLDLFDQLYISLSGAVEAASTIKGSFFYPAVDLAWQYSELFDSDVVNFGKFRFAWGKVGIQPAPYKFSTLAGTGFDAFGGSFVVDAERGNENLKPEVKREWEIGTDLRFLMNRITLSATYYSNRTEGILFAVRTNPSSGFTFNYENAAVIENKGLELDLLTRIISTGNFHLSLFSNFNNNKNLVVDIAGAETVDIGGTSKAVQGYPMSSFYLPGSLRDDNDNLILDANGFPQLDRQARVLGDPNPDWRGGLGMEMRWKGFDFSFLFEHSQGGNFINRTRVVLYGFGTHADVGHDVVLTEDVVNINGQVFEAGTRVRGNIEDFGGGNVLLDESWYRGIGGGLGFGKVNDFYVEDATWTKLRNITLGYTFTNLDLSSSIRVSTVRLSVTGRDLILWSDLIGVDPETNNYGVSNAFGMNYFNNPGTRSLLFNLQVTF